MYSSLVIGPYSVPMSQIRLSLNLSCNVFKSSLWPAHKVGQNASGLSSVISIISYKACLPLVSSSETPESLPPTILGLVRRVDWLLTELNHVVHEGKLRKGCFVRLKSYQANQVKGKRYGSHYMVSNPTSDSVVGS